MKQLLFLTVMMISLVAQATNDPLTPRPKWSVSLHFDHISFPSFSKYRPKAKRSDFFKSWSFTAGRVIQSPEDGKGMFHQLYVGILKNNGLQKGCKAGIQSGFTSQGRNSFPMFQGGLDAGGLMLFERARKLGSDNEKMYPHFRLQWTGGLFANAGVTVSSGRNSSYLASYKLWMQGPYIRKHAAALPHQSVGLITYQKAK